MAVSGRDTVVGCTQVRGSHNEVHVVVGVIILRRGERRKGEVEWEEEGRGGGGREKWEGGGRGGREKWEEGGRERRRKGLLLIYVVYRFGLYTVSFPDHQLQ